MALLCVDQPIEITLNLNKYNFFCKRIGDKGWLKKQEYNELLATKPNKRKLSDLLL